MLKPFKPHENSILGAIMSHTQHPLTVEIHVPNAEALHELSIFLAGFLAKHHAPHHSSFAAETTAPGHQVQILHAAPHGRAEPASHGQPIQHQAAAPQYLQQAQTPAQQPLPRQGQDGSGVHPQTTAQPSISFQDLMTLQSQLIEARCIDPAGILRIYGEYGYSAAQLPQPHHFGAIYEKLAAHRRPQ